jgi:hypothetical protein
MKGLAIAAAAAAATACLAWLAPGRGADVPASAQARTVAVRVGDRILVLGAPLGCRIVRMRQLQDSVTIDCRRAGSLRGTYGTLLTARGAALARFESDGVAKLAVVAEHRGSVHECGERR